jgi:phosphatidylinositol glycan class F
LQQQQHIQSQSMAATAATPPKTTKSHPIESWDDGLSPIYTHLHPLLLLGLFYYQFPSLVDKPVDTLLQTALGVAALQLVYLCICIPGSNQAQLPQRGKKKGKTTQSNQGDTGFGAKLVVSRLHRYKSLVGHLELLLGKKKKKKEEIRKK